MAVDEIADRLLKYDVAEYIRLRFTCKVWMNIITDPCEGGALNSRFRPRRWTMLSSNTDGVCRSFLNLSSGACALIDLPVLSTHHLESSIEGLLLLRHNRTMCVLNPLTRALTNLPPLSVELGHAYSIWFAYLFGTPYIFYVGISDETSPASVMLMMRDVNFIAYAKPGDDGWTLMIGGLLGSMQYLSVLT